MLPKVGVSLLTALKPIKRQGWWKGKFVLLKMPAIWEGEGRLLPLTTSGQELLQVEGMGYM